MIACSAGVVSAVRGGQLHAIAPQRWHEHAGGGDNRNRRHQVRHLASIGHPVLSDALYGDQASATAAPRLMLHAARLTLTHPRTGNRFAVRSPLPDDFAPRSTSARSSR